MERLYLTLSIFIIYLVFLGVLCYFLLNLFDLIRDIHSLIPKLINQTDVSIIVMESNIFGKNGSITYPFTR